MDKALSISAGEELATLIPQKRAEKLQTRITSWPRKNLIASDIGECDRYMAYSVLDWEKRQPHDTNLQARFDVGNQVEDSVIRELGDIGFKVVENQSPFEVKDKNGKTLVSGRIDGKILHNGRRVPFEVKSLNPNVFQQLNSIEDFDKKPWLRRYVRQMQVYLYANNE